jgi:hypothetical protein
VEAQARARVEGDNLTFMGYALPDTRSAGGGPARAFELIEAKADGDEGTSLVRYIGPKGSGSYALKQRWRRIDESWRVVSFERPPELIEGPTGWYKAVGMLKKIYNFGPNPGEGGRRRR